jgi:hypothetical protein
MQRDNRHKSIFTLPTAAYYAAKREEAAQKIREKHREKRIDEMRLAIYLATPNILPAAPNPPNEEMQLELPPTHNRLTRSEKFTSKEEFEESMNRPLPSTSPKR